MKNTVCFPVTGPTCVELRGMAPFGEELSEGEGLRRAGRLDVEDAVVGVGVQPVEAASGFDEGALGGLHRLEARNADAVRNDAGLPVHEDRQMGVDVGDGLLAGVALDPVHRLTRGGGAQGRQLWSLGNRNAFRAWRRGRDRRSSVAMRGWPWS